MATNPFKGLKDPFAIDFSKIVNKGLLHNDSLFYKNFYAQEHLRDEDLRRREKELEQRGKTQKDIEASQNRLIEEIGKKEKEYIDLQGTNKFEDKFITDMFNEKFAEVQKKAREIVKKTGINSSESLLELNEIYNGLTIDLNKYRQKVNLASKFIDENSGNYNKDEFNKGIALKNLLDTGIDVTDIDPNNQKDDRYLKANNAIKSGINYGKIAKSVVDELKLPTDKEYTTNIKGNFSKYEGHFFNDLVKDITKNKDGTYNVSYMNLQNKNEVSPEKINKIFSQIRNAKDNKGLARFDAYLDNEVRHNEKKIDDEIYRIYGQKISEANEYLDDNFNKKIDEVDKKIDEVDKKIDELVNSGSMEDGQIYDMDNEIDKLKEQKKLLYDKNKEALELNDNIEKERQTKKNEIMDEIKRDVITLALKNSTQERAGLKEPIVDTRRERQPSLIDTTNEQFASDLATKIDNSYLNPDNSNSINFFKQYGLIKLDGVNGYVSEDFDRKGSNFRKHFSFVKSYDTNEKHNTEEEKIYKESLEALNKISLKNKDDIFSFIGEKQSQSVNVKLKKYYNNKRANPHVN